MLARGILLLLAAFLGFFLWDGLETLPHDYDDGDDELNNKNTCAKRLMGAHVLWGNLHRGTRKLKYIFKA